ncbi:hypothetical protein BJ742DRAFT_806257 [Cladochytrium replicatum]|nr:hypothetical protein BJ742DRAFT_806257 [Cladochytrium replicatum]
MSFVLNPTAKQYPLFEKDILEASCISEVTKAVAVAGAFGGVSSAAFGWWIAAPKDYVYRDMLKKSAIFAGFGGLYYGTYCNVAQTRGKNDFWNAAISGAVTGTALGLRSGTIKAIAAHTVFLGVLSGFGYGMVEQSESKYGLTMGEKMAHRSEGYFVGEKRDPFAARIKELEAKEAA